MCERAGARTTCSEGPQSRLQEPSLVPECARKKQQLSNSSKQNNCAVLFACSDHFQSDVCEENSGVGAARVLFVGVVGSMENAPILGVRIVRVCRCLRVRQVFGGEV